MKKFGRVLLVLLALFVLMVIILSALGPWMDRFGATKEEIAANLPGDELVSNPAIFSNRVMSINAKPAEVYPWLAQIGADRGGFYSYTWIDHMINCKLVDINMIVPELQNPQIGDEVKMCPNDPAPPPYVVALVEKDQAFVIGHQEDGKWVETWQMVIVPQTDGTSRLIFRGRSEMTGLLWKVIHPGEFLMQYGMLNGIKSRAEKTFKP